MFKNTPDVIESLPPNCIFVFGSNTLGKHGRGAARQAYYDFGAEYGIGEGLTGQSYALPTLDEYYKQRTDEELLASIHRLYRCATAYPSMVFLLTKIGCGLAGYAEDHMKSLLFHAGCEWELETGTAIPFNIVFPEGWR